ncbi:sigma-70 family RNA polymerase sigma factor [uncultured Bacteroides sp.]|uniref:sigma-70 family RNA polymerase sigma factor n=1 Tax=uncultured Bacteroides sp. TaxID=162156 RepID=UPI0025E888D0|nr:sigma-70 family RNA polymerase sigma factor [uncultured Bacteroides sp.]
MGTNTSTSYSTDFSEFYQEYRHIILNFITCRIPYKCEAEDLTQDVFIRLWEHWAFVNKDTVWSLVYTIARNIITDKIRRYYRLEDFVSYIYNNLKEVGRNSVEEDMYYHELEQIHNRTVSLLPAKRRRIYELSFNDELSCPVIAKMMSLSSRTVEGQLLAARKTVRAYVQNELSQVG